MRHIERSEEPEILRLNKVQWTEEFINSGENRPKGYRYRHKQILDELCLMSRTKCFYCETKLKGNPNDVEHNIEVSVDKSLAYEWSNLYLSCKACNGKKKETVISHLDALDPCLDSDDTIKLHITFYDEQIIEIDDSEKGRKTIDKYKLDSQDHDYKRMKKLRELHDVIDGVKDDMIKEGRQDMTQAEKDKIKVFAHHSQEYSLMCEIYLLKRLPSVFE